MITPLNSACMQKNNSLAFKRNSADAFLEKTNKADRKMYEDSFATKYMTSPCAIYPPTFGILGYEFYAYKKTRKIDKKSLTEAQKDAVAKGVVKKLLVATAIGVAVSGALSAYFNSKYDENLKETKDYFNSINKTSAKLADKEFNSMVLGAMYNPFSGEVLMNKAFIRDPWNNYKNKFFLKHELVHAKQFETIARMDDGVRKLNYSVMKNYSKQVKENAPLKIAFDNSYKDIMADESGKYDNAKMKLTGYEVPYKEFVLTIHRLARDEEKDYTDIPMFIDAEHYNKVREKMGSLTPEEDKKAQAYYDAELNYTSANFFNALNPWSAYYQNLLEKEAFKENPWFTRIL